MIKWALATVACMASLASSAAAQEDAGQLVRVMVVGSYHFANPGMDLNNARIAPVTTPEKQAELEALSHRLMAFAPTAVAVERTARDADSLSDPIYPGFTLADLTTQADERYQIGYRLAAKIGNGRVYAIDEQSEERDYFPFQPVLDWWNAKGMASAFAEFNAPIAASMKALEARQSKDSIGNILADINRPETVQHEHQFYFKVLSAGDGRSQPGAALNAGWFERNARIVAKLMSVAKPGDRIVVVYGSGHNYWLRMMIANTPGYVLEEASPYLADPVG